MTGLRMERDFIDAAHWYIDDREVSYEEAVAWAAQYEWEIPMEKKQPPITKDDQPKKTEPDLLGRKTPPVAK